MHLGRWYQYFTVCMACLGAIQIGLILGWSSPILPLLESPKIESPIKTAFSQSNAIMAISPLTATLGALLGGRLANHFGRRPAMSFTGIPSLVCWLVIIVYPTVVSLFISRAVLGICMGILAVVVPIYIAEISETQIRGILGSIFQFFLLGGEITMFAVGLFKNYYIVSVPGIVCSLMILISWFAIPSTPIYLAKIGRDDEMERVLKNLRPSNYDISDEIADIKMIVKIYTESSLSIAEIVLHRAKRKSVIIGIFMMVFQQMSGINVIIFYSQVIFERAIPNIESSILSLCTGLLMISATILSGLAADTAGRKTLLIISGFGMVISYWALGTNFLLQNDLNIPEITIGAVVVYIISFSLGWGMIPWIMIGEIFTLEMKSFGSGLSCIVNFSFTFIVSYGFRLLVRLMGEACTFYLFGAMSIVGMIFVLTYVPETKNKTFLEIQKQLAGE